MDHPKRRQMGTGRYIGHLLRSHVQDIDGQFDRFIDLIWRTAAIVGALELARLLYIIR